MECATAGDWRAYLDGELPAGERDRLGQHLIGCASCRAELTRVEANAAVAFSALNSLAPSAAEIPAASWSRVRERVDGRAAAPVTRSPGVTEMFRNLIGFAGGTRMRLAVSALTLITAMAMLMAFTPVGMAASDLLSIFRVKKFVAVTVDPNSMPNLAAPSDLGSFTTTGDKATKQVTLTEAQKAVGFQVPSVGAVPAGLEPLPRSVMTTGAFSATFTPDMQKVRAYLTTIGATNVNLPDNLNGVPVTLRVAPAVAQLYMERGPQERGQDGMLRPVPGQKFLYLGATTSPTLDVPDGIDVEQVRSELLKVPGLPADLVSQLKNIDDWRNTVVVPVVKGKSSEVTVQGQPGLMVREDSGPGTTLLWQKDGVVYTVTGNLSEAEVLRRPIL